MAREEGRGLRTSDSWVAENVCSPFTKKEKERKRKINPKQDKKEASVEAWEQWCHNRFALTDKNINNKKKKEKKSARSVWMQYSLCATAGSEMESQRGGEGTRREMIGWRKDGCWCWCWCWWWRWGGARAAATPVVAKVTRSEERPRRVLWQTQIKTEPTENILRVQIKSRRRHNRLNTLTHKRWRG